MHEVVFAESVLANLRISDWFHLDPPLIDHLATNLLPNDGSGHHHVRRGNEILPEGKFVIGVPPQEIEAELSRLRKQIDLICSIEASDSMLRAAAFFHLGFEAIHPLCDGNGRIGRTILAGQCAAGYNIRPHEVMQGIIENTAIYRMIFLEKIPDESRFELLLDMLARILGMTDPYPNTSLPFPLFPANTKRIDGRFRFVPV